MVPLMSPSPLSCCIISIRKLFSCHLICALGLVIRTFDPHIHVYPDQPSRLVGMRGDFQRKGSACSNLSSIARKQPSAANSSRVRPALRKAVNFKTSDNERGLADAYNNAVHIAEQDRPRGAALAAEEEHVLRCLGAAVIMQWNILPTLLQREIFDTAGSVGKLLETAALRGQIARFLHKHKNEAGRGKLPLTEDTPSDARSGAAALSRWDNEGGAVREELPV